MDPNRSDRACNLCRQRRVRCDKTLPSCQRCSKYGLPCPGYPSRQRFVDQSHLVRTKLAEGTSDSPQRSGVSSNSSPKAPTNSASFETRFQNGEPPRIAIQSQILPVVATFDSGSLPPTASNEATSDLPSRVLNPESQAQFLTAPEVIQAPREHFGLEDSMQQLLEDSGSDYFDLDIETYYANEENACGFFPGIPVALPQEDEVDMLDIMYDPVTMSYEQNMVDFNGNGSFSNPRIADPNKQEVALLVHLFVECLAPWMDLFDIDAYFTRVLPRDASLNTLLQSALAAVAAKQTARHVMMGGFDATSRQYAYLMANFQNVSSNEWFYKAACYYDRGISHLRARLQQSSVFGTGGFSSKANTPSQVSNRGIQSPITPSPSPSQASNKNADVQQLFSAISVFSLYETLDDCFAASSQHLPGFLALFDRNDSAAFPTPPPAGRAAFWYFARKEALSAYAHDMKPKIDPDNMAIWIAAGLPLSVYHFLSTGTPSSAATDAQSNVLGNHEAMPYVLIWVLVKVIDLISSNNEGSTMSSPQRHNVTVHDTPSPGYPLGDYVQSFRATWNKLRALLQLWYERRPPLLVPYAIVETTSPYMKTSHRPLRTAFFTCPTAAATLQLYHFVQILLLTNQPTNRKDQGSRLRMLKDNSAEVEYHSREICAIALGRQSLAIQRQMSHPLQLASAHFETKEDRDAICELLREVAIETSSPIELPC